MRRIALAAFAMLALTGLARSGDAEINAAQTVIDSQIRAFLAGDNARAYGFASSGIRDAFPSVEAFMGMVNGAYLPLAKPKNWSFGAVDEPGAQTVRQRLLVTGPDGKAYEAVYVVEKQPDGSWKITSVSMQESRTVGA
ncbi:MAG: DUF4864 domain-containing protein [Rhizobiaceae bacterium]